MGGRLPPRQSAHGAVRVSRAHRAAALRSRRGRAALCSRSRIRRRAELMPLGAALPLSPRRAAATSLFGRDGDGPARARRMGRLFGRGAGVVGGALRLRRARGLVAAGERAGAAAGGAVEAAPGQSAVGWGWPLLSTVELLRDAVAVRRGGLCTRSASATGTPSGSARHHRVRGGRGGARCRRCAPGAAAAAVVRLHRLRWRSRRCRRPIFFAYYRLIGIRLWRY